MPYVCIIPDAVRTAGHKDNLKTKILATQEVLRHSSDWQGAKPKQPQVPVLALTTSAATAADNAATAGRQVGLNIAFAAKSTSSLVALTSTATCIDIAAEVGQGDPLNVPPAANYSTSLAALASTATSIDIAAMAGHDTDETSSDIDSDSDISSASDLDN